MFLHFGELVSVNGITGVANLPSVLASSSGPVFLSMHKEGKLDVSDANKETISNLHYLLGVMKQPAYIRVDVNESNALTTVALAVASAKAQITNIYNLFIGYQSGHLLSGFVIDSITNNSYADGSVWSNAAINSIVDYAHAQCGLGVALVIDPALDFMSLRRTPKSTFSLSLAYNDMLIHRSPLFTDTVWYDGTIKPDLSRMAGVLQTMKALPVNQCVVQEFDMTATPQPDSAGGFQMTSVQIQIAKRAAYFFEVCGIADYCICADKSLGASTGVLHRGIYEPLGMLDKSGLLSPNPYGKATVTIEVDAHYVYVKASVDGQRITLGIFSKDLKPAIKLDANGDYMQDVFGFNIDDTGDPLTIVGGFGEVITDGVPDPLATQILDSVDLTLAIRDIYRRLAALG